MERLKEKRWNSSHCNVFLLSSGSDHLLCLVAEECDVDIAQDQIQVEPINTTAATTTWELNQTFFSSSGVWVDVTGGTHPFLFGRYASMSKNTFSFSLICVLMSLISSSSFSSQLCTHLWAKGNTIIRGNQRETFMHLEQNSRYLVFPVTRRFLPLHAECKAWVSHLFML